MIQESKQLERQQHSEEQHRLHVSAFGLDHMHNTTNGSAIINGTDHVDDFLARIDKLRQVRQSPDNTMQCMDAHFTACTANSKPLDLLNMLAAHVID